LLIWLIIGSRSGIGDGRPVMTIREGKWKCTYCDMMNRGRDLKCSGCGAMREQDVQFIYDENAPEITDEAHLQTATAGPEWLCETCGTSNPSAREDCRQCGAPRGGSRAREVKMIGAPVPAPPPPPPSKFPLKTLGAIAISLIFFFGLIFLYFTRTHDTELAVDNVKWQRSVEVEEYKTLTEQGWENEIPSDARVLSRRREFHHNDKIQVGTRPVEQTYTEKVQVGTKKVKVGTKDMGNGYFKDIYEDKPVYEDKKRTKVVQEPIFRDEPVYKNKVTYQIDRWKAVKTEQAQGNDNSPLWPKITEGPKIRAGKKTEKYLVTLKDTKKGKIYEQEVAESDFTRFTPGSICRASINNLGSIKKLDPPGKN
jgi:hypothetical protein